MDAGTATGLGVTLGSIAVGVVSTLVFVAVSFLAPLSSKNP